MYTKFKNLAKHTVNDHKSSNKILLKVQTQSTHPMKHHPTHRTQHANTANTTPPQLENPVIPVGKDRKGTK